MSSGPDEAVVRTWTMSTGFYKNQTKDDIADILLEKTFRLKAGERIVTVEYAFTNRGRAGKRIGFWSQSAVDFDGIRKNNVYWRPTRHCVDWIDLNRSTSEYGYWYTAQPVAGWNGVSNSKLKRGVMFLMNYNDLKQFYDNAAANTVEWMYDDVAIPAGKTWRTVIKMIPTEGYSGYVYGDDYLVADFNTVITPAGLKITHTLSASTRPLHDVVLTTEVCGVRDSWSVRVAPVALPQVGFAPLEETSLVVGLGGFPCIVKVDLTAQTVAGQPIRAHYENYFAGTAGRNMDLTTLEPLHEFTIPGKQKQYLKPDRIALTRAETPKILFVRGLWAGYNGIDEALETMGDVHVVDGWMKKTALGEALGNFPGSYEVLLGYDVIILGNVSGPMLSDVGQEMLVDFVKAGGGLLMLGGDRTYGQTTFSNKTFADLIPVEFDGYGDYERLPKTSGFKKGSAHPVLEGVTFDGREAVLYTHRLREKPGAVRAVSLDNDLPALVLSGTGKKRVAVVCILPFGEEPKGMHLYRNSAAWRRLMANTLQWLIGRSDESR